VNDLLRASPISWSALVALVLATIAGVFGYGQLAQRVKVLEDLQPMAVSTKLAVIEANQVRSALDINQIQRDLSELRRQLLSDWRQQRQ
jgi:hypothetical protein